MAHINNYNGNEFLCKEPDLAKVTTEMSKKLT